MAYKDPDYRRKYRQRNREKIAAYDKAWRARNPQKRAEYQAKLYGLTREEVRAMWEAQEGKCAICERPAAECVRGVLAIDHDHVSGQVRKLLCMSCNGMLGMARDDPAVLERGADYLKALDRRF
jgi:Recombination endonuclease VII